MGTGGIIGAIKKVGDRKGGSGSSVDSNLGDTPGDVDNNSPLLLENKRSSATDNPPESADFPIISYPAEEGMIVRQAVVEGQINPQTGQVDRPGGFFTKDEITSQQQVVDEFAVKPEWGPQKTHVQEFEFIKGTQLQESIIGPQIGSDGTVYLGGKNQLEPLVSFDKRNDVVVPVGTAKLLPSTIPNSNLVDDVMGRTPSVSIGASKD